MIPTDILSKPLVVCPKDPEVLCKFAYLYDSNPTMSDFTECILKRCLKNVSFKDGYLDENI